MSKGSDWCMSFEIERKFLLERFPKKIIEKGNIQKVSVERIKQSYIAITKDEEVRIRHITNLFPKNESAPKDKFVLTVKKDIESGYRVENEIEISKEIYNKLLKSSGFKPLVKKRTTLEMDDYLLEIDEYRDFNTIVVEVEFRNLIEMKNFIAPEWFGKEITGKKKYSNKTMWRKIQKKK